RWRPREGRNVLGTGLVGSRLRRLLPRHRAATRPEGHARGEARAQPPRAEGRPRADARPRRRGHLLRRLRHATFHFAEAFRALEWDPPRVMGTAFMFYSNSNKWAEGLEGWHGVDQLGEDGANPNYNAMVRRFEERFGRTTRNVVVALAYDTARVAIHGIGNAAIPEPRWVKEGMERIRWMPATNGGPSTYIQFGPHDRKGYKGDFLTIRELR